MNTFAVALCLFFNVLHIFCTGFEIPSSHHPSTSDPYEIYLANTFPLEIQTIENYQNNESFYEKLIDRRMGTPFYAGLNVTKSRQIYVESFFNHFRTLDSSKKTIISAEICQANTSATVIPNNRKIISIFHELNLPFEVPCFTCQLSSDGQKTPNFFRIVNKRNIFAHDILSESATVYDYVKEKFEKEGEPQIYAGDISEEDGSFQWSPRLISEKLDFISFDFYVPNPLTKVEENSMSLFCSKEESGILNPPEIIVNVDTLRRIPTAAGATSENATLFEGVEKNSSHLFSTNDTHRFTVGDLTEWKEYQKINTFPKLNVEYNLKVDIYWENWSCCSACCCSLITCSQGYETNEASCKLVESLKNRRGFLSFFKIDQQKPIEILSSLEIILRGTDLYSELLEEVVEMFDLYLSSSPYVDSGIPVYSTLLQNDHSWLILEQFLNSYFQYRNETESFTGHLGLFIDSETCATDPQKFNCTILQQCLDNELQTSEYIPAPIITEEDITVAPPPHQPNLRYPSKSDICDYHAVEDVSLKQKESVIDVDEGLSFRFAVDEAEYGEILSTKWKGGTKKISKFDPKKSCSAQRIFTDNHYLMILKVESDDANLPYTAVATFKATGEEISLKLSLKYKSKAKPSKYTDSILKWVAIAGGVLAAFIIIVVIVHIIQVRSLKRKLKQAAPATAATTADQV